MNSLFIGCLCALPLLGLHDAIVETGAGFDTVGLEGHKAGESARSIVVDSIFARSFMLD